MPVQREHRGPDLVAVGAAVERDLAARPARRTARPAPGPGLAASAASPGRPRRGRRRGEEVRQAGHAGLHRAGRARRPSARSPCARPVTLTCWPITVRTAVSSPSTCPGTRSPGRATHQRAEHRVVGEVRVDRRGVGSRRRAGGGPAPPRPAGRAGRRAGRSPRRAAVRAAGLALGRVRLVAQSHDTVPGACGRSRVRAYQPGPAVSTPGDDVVGEEVEQRAAGEGRAHRESHRQRRGPAAGHGVAPGGAGARSGGAAPAARSASRRRPPARCR